MAKTNRADDVAALDEVNIDLDEGFLDFDEGFLDFDEIGDLPPPDMSLDYSIIEPVAQATQPRHPNSDRSPADNVPCPSPISRTKRGVDPLGLHPIPMGQPLFEDNKSVQSGTKKKTNRTGANTKRQRSAGGGGEYYPPNTSASASGAKKKRKKKQSQNNSTACITPKDPYMQLDVASPANKKKTSKRRSLPTNQKRTSGEPPMSLNPSSGTTSSSNTTKARRNNKLSTPKPIRASSKKEENAFFPFSNAPVNESEPFNTMYPNLYKIFSSSSSEGQSLHSNGNPNTLMNVVFQFVGTRIEISEAQLDPAAQLDPNYVNSLKNRDVHIGIDEASIGLSKNFLREMNCMHVVTELRGLLAKVKHQSNFLKKQIHQMNTWCKENYGMGSTSGIGSSSSHSSHGAISNFHASASQLALSVGVSQDAVDDIINVKDPPLLSVKVKIKCIGLKKPHILPLDAHIMPTSGTSTALITCGVPIFKRPKKEPPLVAQRVQPKAVQPQRRKKVQPVQSRSSTTTKPTGAVVKGKKRSYTYESMNHSDRRKLITKLLAERAFAFEQNVRKADSKRQSKVDKRLGKVSKILEKHVDHAMTNEDFWEMSTALSHWQNQSKQDIIADLSPVWQPELSKRKMHWSEPPTPVIIKSKNGANSTDGPKSGSIFSRLQSLLVEEDVDDNDEDSSDEDADDDDDDVVSIVGMNESNEKDSGLVDFSELSLDQRTYIQLRSIHLIDQSLLPSMVASVVEKEESEAPKFVHDSIDATIRKMQMKLSDKHKENNARVAILKRLAIDETSNVRSRDEEEMAIITKFNNLSKNKSDKVHTIQKLKVDVDADEWVPT